MNYLNREGAEFYERLMRESHSFLLLILKNNCRGINNSLKFSNGYIILDTLFDNIFYLKFEDRLLKIDIIWKWLLGIFISIWVSRVRDIFASNKTFAFFLINIYGIAVKIIKVRITVLCNSTGILVLSVDT